jgi:hypothetical protein
VVYQGLCLPYVTATPRPIRGTSKATPATALTVETATEVRNITAIYLGKSHITCHLFSVLQTVVEAVNVTAELRRCRTFRLFSRAHV